MTQLCLSGEGRSKGRASLNLSAHPSHLFCILVWKPGNQNKNVDREQKKQRLEKWRKQESSFFASWRRRRAILLRSLFFIAFALSGGIALYSKALQIWQLPVRQVEEIQEALPAAEKLDAKELAELINEYRSTTTSSIGTVATILGGLGLFINIYIASQRLKLDTKKISDDHLLAESRLTGDRFTQAIEQLGNESIHIRLGGIYSLEQLAKDSPEDHWTVMEVLTAFIREESPVQKTPTSEELESPKLRTDIQAVTKALRRRVTETTEFWGMKLDLSNTNLSDANLNGAKLSYANLSEASLFDANLIGADLIGADLSGANLIDADLREADLSGADLSGANLREADLIEADLIEADLSGASLFDANLSRADLKGANLKGADMKGANLSRADLRGADLNKATLSGVDLSRADLRGADLNKATLSGVDLSRADLKGANLKGADLIGANLIGANLREANLSGANLFAANLSNANLFAANLREADLSGATVTDTQFRTGVGLSDEASQNLIRRGAIFEAEPKEKDSNA